MKTKKKGNNLFFAACLGILFGLVLPGFFIIAKYKQTKAPGENIYNQTPQPEIKWEERAPIPAPKGWKTYKINNDASISIPSEWYFFSHSQNPDTKEKNYTISNLKKLEYDDWNPGEKFRINIGTHQTISFDERVKEEVDRLYRLNYYKNPGEVAPYSIENFLINGHKTSRFKINGGKATTTRYLQIVELENNRLLEVLVSFWDDVPTEQIAVYMERFKTILDSLTIK